MKVFAFVGPSGTGKSYRAQWVARENELDCIIDDGLLIKENKILAGKSAKKEASRIASVKRAIFMDENHAKEVKDAICKEEPKGILVLGTSDEMVKKIAEKLELPSFEKTIYIEEVATDKEIEKARYLRKQLGKHVIPVPTVEIKNQFSGYFLNPLKIFRKKENIAETTAFEKTIVRPAFSYMGEYTISETVTSVSIGIYVSFNLPSLFNEKSPFTSAFLLTDAISTPTDTFGSSIVVTTDVPSVTDEI